VIYDRTNLSQAVSANDDAADSANSMLDIVKSLGFDIEGLDHVANQRALRLVIAASRGTRGLTEWMSGAPANLSLAERDALAAFSTMFIDGAAAVARVHQMEVTE
jgi:1-deoxy-D-xylulose 5-phosphate reductoisomerase